MLTGTTDGIRLRAPAGNQLVGERRDVGGDDIGLRESMQGQRGVAGSGDQIRRESSAMCPHRVQTDVRSDHAAGQFRDIQLLRDEMIHLRRQLVSVDTVNAELTLEEMRDACVLERALPTRVRQRVRQGHQPEACD